MSSIANTLVNTMNRCHTGIERILSTRNGILKTAAATTLAAVGAGLFAAIVGASEPVVILITAFVGLAVFGAIAYEYGAPITGMASLIGDGFRDLLNDLGL